MTYMDVGNPPVTRPNGQQRVRCGLPVIREELVGASSQIASAMPTFPLLTSA
jgi:hypothetical protein